MTMQLFGLNRLRWPARWPIKWALLGLTVLVVCFPNPSRLIRHVRHFSNPNALIEPNAPAMQPMVDELRATLTEELAPSDALKRIERFVYEKIPYEWDWNTWGSADYLPTVTEVIEMGKEDCDGRAVVAASLLRRFGFEAHLVNDLAHMWVRTDYGDTMSPGKKPFIVATDDGPQLHLDALVQLPKALAYGIAVFPARREMIVLTMMWLLLLRPGGGATRGAVGLVLLVTGLFVIRGGSSDYWNPTPWMQWAGLVGLGAGGLVVMVGARARSDDGVACENVA